MYKLIKFGALAMLVFCAACKSPLAELKPPSHMALEVKITMEDHSRNLKRLRAVSAGEANTAPARSTALESHRAWLEAEFRAEAKERGLALEEDAPWRLELNVTSLGEVRARYIFYGIASGVAWGVGTGILAHDPRLAVGLGLYELVEESAFWIAGSAFFGAYSAPAVMEVALFQGADKKATWTESYYVLNGRKHLKGLPEDQSKDRTTQLHATLRLALDKLFHHLEALPEFPKRAGASRPFTHALP